MNIISNTASVRLFLVIPMAEGVACVDRKLETVLLITKPTKLHLPSTSRSSRQASKAAVSTWTEFKKRPEVRLHTKSPTDAIVEAIRLWDIPGTYLEFPRVLQQSLWVLSLWRLTSGRFLSSVHVNTAALLARLEDRLVLGRCSFVGLVTKRTVSINTGYALSHWNNQK